MKRTAFYTLGCKVNQYETEAMSELFEKSGYSIVDFEEMADIYVINTCTVTSMSDRKSRQIIRRAKKKNPYALIIVCGCYAQVSPDEVMSIDGVNLVIGTQDRRHIVELAENLTQDAQECCVHDISKNHKFEDMTINSYSDRTRAFIKVQEGCNQFCSYCIIPYARGPIRSRDMDDVYMEANRIADSGFREIILTGIHIASYGRDKKGYGLAELLNRLNEIDGIERIRMSSIEPMMLNSEFIEKIKTCNKLCPHFHLSLQSGCDETLKRMNRRYITEEYYSIVNSIRNHFDNVAVTTDIMVGFPGETEDEFEKTAEFVRYVDFADAHIFQYSPRKGTPAAAMKDQINPGIKEERSKRIEGIIRDSRNRFLKKNEGLIQEVLFEQRCHDNKNYFEGKTPNYITVRVKTDEDLSNTMVNVHLQKACDDYIIGEIVDNEKN